MLITYIDDNYVINFFFYTSFFPMFLFFWSFVILMLQPISDLSILVIRLLPALSNHSCAQRCFSLMHHYHPIWSYSHEHVWGRANQTIVPLELVIFYNSRSIPLSSFFTFYPQICINMRSKACSLAISLTLRLINLFDMLVFFLSTLIYLM